MLIQYFLTFCFPVSLCACLCVTVLSADVLNIHYARAHNEIRCRAVQEPLDIAVSVLRAV